MLKILSRSVHPRRITPAAPPPERASSPEAAIQCESAGELLPEVYAPPEVIQGDGGDADWALWDACMDAWDQQRQPAAGLNLA